MHNIDNKSKFSLYGETESVSLVNLQSKNSHLLLVQRKMCNNSILLLFFLLILFLCKNVLSVIILIYTRDGQ